MFSYSTPQILKLVEKIHGRENMEAALAHKKGVLCLAAHFGNWEILPIFTHHQGWKTAVVAQTLYDSRLDALLNDYRQSHGVMVIKRQQVTKEIIRCLRSNMLLGILNDQDTRVDSRWAPFFGKMAKTPVGIIRLARKFLVPIVPVFIARQANGKNHLYIEPEISIDYSEDEERDLVLGAALCNQAIEKFIRRFPEQWVWFHERWKSIPQETQVYAEKN
jgi:Kdo2-lipid IVA lauroyltransferase/acyltransferase